MKTRIGLKSLLAVFAFAVCFMFAEVKSNADVLDYANLFTESEETEIDEFAEEVKKHIHMDVVVLTTDDAEGYETKYFADEVYNGMKGKEFGTGKKRSGFIYTIDMDNREIFIQGYGDAILYLTDEASDNIIDNVFSDIASEEYSKSAITALKEVKKLYDRGISANQYTYNTETGEIVRYKSIRPWEWIISMLIAFISSFLFFNGVRQSHKNNAKISRNFGLNAGFADAPMNNLIAEGDELIDRKQYTRIIPTRSTRSGGGDSGRSSTFSGSSGRSFSGSGRKF